MGWKSLELGNKSVLVAYLSVAAALGGIAATLFLEIIKAIFLN